MHKIGLFLDRDGVLNVNTHYTHLVEDLYLCEGVIDFFKKLHDWPMLVPVVVTNQSGVDREYYRVGECIKFEDALAKRIKEETGYTLWRKRFYHSWTTKDLWSRKPNPGMLQEACLDWKLIPGYMIGDKESDRQAGQRAGCRMSFKVSKQVPITTFIPIIERDLKAWYLTRDHFKHPRIRKLRTS